MKRIFLFIFLFGIVLVLTSAAGLGLNLYFQEHPLSNLLLERSSILLVVGLAAGFASRIILHKWHVFWRILFSILAAGLALYILDRFFISNYMDIISIENWKDPIWIFLQAGISGLMAILAGIIWHKRRKVKTVARRETAVVTASKAQPVPKPIQVKAQKSKIKKKTRKVLQKKVVSPKPALAIRPGVKAKTTGVFLGSRRLHRKDVRLLGETEHRCPYCLELVKKNDPRGVVICPECKTWHHKDCWDVTGTCQVAHRHDL